LRIGKKQ